MVITKDKIYNLILDFVETAVACLAIFFVVYIFVAQPHQVNGHSMDPTLQTQEYLLTEKISYRFGQPQRGDIIVFRAPTNACIGDNCDYIKRIIGLPGDRVKVAGGKFYINDQELDESLYLAETVFTSPGGFTQNEKEILLGENQYFVSGDNRPGSSDSRYWGPIDKKAIIGKAFFSYWPINTFGIIAHAN